MYIFMFVYIIDIIPTETLTPLLTDTLQHPNRFCDFAQHSFAHVLAHVERLGAQ